MAARAEGRDSSNSASFSIRLRYWTWGQSVHQIVVVFVGAIEIAPA
jgi:hypothetical protein